MPTAVLIDGDFFLKRYRYLCGSQAPEKAAADLHWMCCQHLVRRNAKSGKEQSKLYRIFFYDCPPLTKTIRNPVSNRTIRLGETPTATWRMTFHDELRRLRKVALRLGYLNERMGQWVIKPEALKDLLSKRKTVDELVDADLRYDVKQMGVDMRIGLDIASMSYKRQVDQIVLVAGDSDFVPAAKLARREGIDFILDPMWASIRADLHEHIDGLRSVFRKKDEATTVAAASIDGADGQSALPPVDSI